MDRSWIHEINRVSQRFKDGVIQFLDVARNCLNSNGETLCPCRKCANILMQTLPAIQAHICTYGFLSTYIVWNKHGELGHVAVEYSDSSSESEGIEAAIHDAVGPNYVHVENATNVAFEEMNDGDQRRYDKMFEELNCGLYEGCTKFSSLEFIIKLMHIKVLNKWSDHSFNMLLELLADAFPTNNRLPRKLGEVKRLLVNVGLGYQTYDVCKYDCFVFMGEDAGKEECPVCHEPRYVRKNEKTKVPHKRLFHFPITPRLKRLFASRKTAKDMRWHHDCHDDDGDLSHPSDAEAWKHVDNLYPDFAADCRNVRLALASDGFNPFGQMSSKYSVWPVILTPYNIPTWKLMKQSFMFLSLLIPGPKSPGKDFDVFMRPLIKELKELWDVGVTTYDVYKKEIFNLRAMVIWTISDFPALAYLSGWSTSGYKACLICGDDTPSVGITCKRCYIGARRWLEPNHRWRNSKEFDGFPETRGPPVELSGKEIISQLNNLHRCCPGKHPNNPDRKRKRTEAESNWTKKSILFELPYWSKLLLRHNLDVMHIEKKVCDNILATLLNIPKKTKDNENARKDLENMGIRKELWLVRRPSRPNALPQASFVLTKSEKDKFFEFMRDVKLPDGYASNVKRYFTEDKKLFGMKTHDCHVVLQKLLPVGLLNFFTKDIRAALIDLCLFFQKICSKKLVRTELKELERGIVIILCKFERIFPPAFFDVMLHLCIHLPQQALLGGPVGDRWMYGVERCLGTYKQYVRNKARPEGSIAQAYVVDEALSYCSMYMSEIETKFSRPERNVDVSEVPQESKVGVFKQPVRCFGGKKYIDIAETKLQLHWYILNNANIQEFFDEHMWILRNEGHANPSMELQQRTFPVWFRSKMEILRSSGSPRATDELYSLALGPKDVYKSWSSCVVNGVRFHCKDRDEKRMTQNCGITTKSFHNGTEVDFYGCLFDLKS